MKYSKVWGDNYFYETVLDTEGKQVLKKNYYLSQVEDCARYMLPLMRNIDLLMNEEDQEKS